MCVAGAPAALRILFRVTENIEANEEFIFILLFTIADSNIQMTDLWGC